MDVPPSKLFEIPELVTIIIEYLQLPLAVAYDQARHDAPLPLQCESARAISTCRMISPTWKSCVEKMPSTLFRDSCVFDCEQVAMDQLMAHGIHVKRLFVRSPKRQEQDINHGGSVAAILGACPELIYIHWACLRPPNLPSQFPQLQNLTRLDFRFTPDAVPGFRCLMSHAPALGHVTIMGVINDVELPPLITLPGSVTTVGLCFSGSTFDEWIAKRWTVPSLDCLVAMTAGSAYKSLAKRATIIDLRPSFAKNPGDLLGNNFSRQLHGLPLYRKGTLVYSTFFPPPIRTAPGAQPRQFQWVEALSLKTSGYGDETEEERWTAALPHLESVIDWFPNLESVDLYDDFSDWKEKPEVQEFVALTEQEGIAWRYV